MKNVDPTYLILKRLKLNELTGYKLNDSSVRAPVVLSERNINMGYDEVFENDKKSITETLERLKKDGVDVLGYIFDFGYYGLERRLTIIGEVKL